MSYPINILLHKFDNLDALTIFFNLIKLFISFCRDKSGVGHGITWRRPLSAKQVDIVGATAFAVSGSSTCLLSPSMKQALYQLKLDWKLPVAFEV